MLREIVNVHQQDPRLRRRWFCDDYFDLFVWEKPGGRIVEFQLCYDKSARERVLKWGANAGFAHHRIDSGEPLPGVNMSPIMVADGVMPLSAVRGKFAASAERLDPQVRDFILQRLRDYHARAAVPLDKPDTGG